MTEATLEKQEHTADTESTRSARTYRPQVDIVERGDELLLAADLPGATADQIDVHFEDSELTIRAAVGTRQKEGVDYLLREYGVGDFYRTFRVSEQIDASRISAEYVDGVLHLHLPKIEAAKTRKIAVAAK